MSPPREVKTHRAVAALCSLGILLAWLAIPLKMPPDPEDKGGAQASFHLRLDDGGPPALAAAGLARMARPLQFALPSPLGFSREFLEEAPALALPVERRTPWRAPRPVLPRLSGRPLARPSSPPPVPERMKWEMPRPARVATNALTVIPLNDASRDLLPALRSALAPWQGSDPGQFWSTTLRMRFDDVGHVRDILLDPPPPLSQDGVSLMRVLSRLALPRHGMGGYRAESGPTEVEARLSHRSDLRAEDPLRGDEP